MSVEKPKNQTANFVISSFILSNRCLNKVYGLTPIHVAILRYIADSIDLNFKKRKSFSTKIYQSQLAKHCFLNCPKALRRNLVHLQKKKLIKYDSQTHLFSLGKVLTTWGFKPLLIEVGLQAPLDRRGVSNPTSNVSNISNRGLLPSASKSESKSHFADPTKQSTSLGVRVESPEEAKRKYEERMAYLLH